jgi:hypothetical protein
MKNWYRVDWTPPTADQIRRSIEQEIISKELELATLKKRLAELNK